jgi:hypothetical protein
MAATGFRAAAIPSLMGVLALQISPEVISSCLLAVYAGLLVFYVLSTNVISRVIFDTWRRLGPMG